MEVLAKSVHWLLPEEPSPCNILLHFRGQYAVAIPTGRPVPFSMLEKLVKTDCKEVYISASDAAVWDAWAKRRRPEIVASEESDAKTTESTAKSLYGNKRAELLTYLQKVFVEKKENPDLEQDLEESHDFFQKLVRQPTLDWYFNQFHEPPDLFHHNARVAYGMSLFLHIHFFVSPKEREAICYSALIHELDGDPVANTKTVVSQQTLDLLKKNKHPVPKEVLDLIELHDELSSGKGFPNQKSFQEIPTAVKVFTLFNHFDVYRMQNKGTRRARFEATQKAMLLRKTDYDPTLWPLFWDFWEKTVEIVT